MYMVYIRLRFARAPSNPSVRRDKIPLDIHNHEFRRFTLTGSAETLLDINRPSCAQRSRIEIAKRVQ